MNCVVRFPAPVAGGHVDGAAALVEVGPLDGASVGASEGVPVGVSVAAGWACCPPEDAYWDAPHPLRAVTANATQATVRGVDVNEIRMMGTVPPTSTGPEERPGAL